MFGMFIFDHYQPDIYISYQNTTSKYIKINRFGDDRKKNIPNMHRSMEIEAGVVLRYLK